MRNDKSDDHMKLTCWTTGNIQPLWYAGEDATKQLKCLSVIVGLLKTTYASHPESLLKVVVSVEPRLKTAAYAVLKPHGMLYLFLHIGCM